MFSKVFSTFALAPSIHAAVAITVAAPATPCAAVHIIAARGSNEAPGAGQMGAAVIQVQSTSRQTVYTAAVDYPASLIGYASSSARGTSATITLLQKQVAACPNQKFVLIRYSQVILN
jgi:acetylxylan esterase